MSGSKEDAGGGEIARHSKEDASLEPDHLGVNLSCTTDLCCDLEIGISSPCLSFLHLSRGSYNGTHPKVF